MTTNVNTQATTISAVTNTTNYVMAGIPDYVPTLSVEDTAQQNIYTDRAGNFEYTLSPDLKSITLVNYIGTPDANGNVVIDDDFDGTPITSISENTFKNNSEKIKQITLVGKLTDINPNAFSGCESLESFGFTSSNNCYSIDSTGSLVKGNQLIKVPQANKQDNKNITSYIFDSNITSIANYAFEGCNLITDITFKGDIVSIGKIGSSDAPNECSAFNDCKNLESINLPNTTTTSKFSSLDGILFDKDQKTLIKYPQAMDGDANQTYEALDFTKTFANNAFQGCNKIKNIKTNGVETIGDHGFDSSILESPTLGDKVTTIGKYAYNNCNRLTSISINSATSSIGYGAFNYCPNLSSISVVNGNSQYVSENGFLYKFQSGYGVDTSTITTPGTANVILIKVPEKNNNPNADYTIAVSNDLTTQKKSITDSTGTFYNITGVDAFAFQGCSSLTSIQIPSSVTTIGGSAFKDCTALNSITFTPPSTTSTTQNYSIGSYAFNNCTSLTNITLPDTLDYLEPYTFKGCSSLANITLNSLTNNVSSVAFDGCNALSKFKTINNPGITKYNYTTDDNGVLFDTRSTGTNTSVLIDSFTGKPKLNQLVKYPTGNIASSYTIPTSVSYIEPYAFRDSTNQKVIKTANLKSVLIDNQNLLYNDKGLLVSPNAFFEKKYNVFDDKSNTYISKIINGDINIDSYFVTGLDDYGTTLRNIIASAKGQITIPSSIDTINEGAFDGISASSIKIPTQTKLIKEGAFDNLSGINSFNVDSGNMYYMSKDSGVLYGSGDATIDLTLGTPKDKNGNNLLTLIKYPNNRMSDNINIDTDYTTDASTTEISNNAFENTRLNSITLGKLVSKVSSTSFVNNSSLTDINVDLSNPDYESIDGVLFSKDGTELIKYPEGKNSSIYTLPDTVTKIDAHAFSNCNKKLTKIQAVNTNITIEDKAFDDNSSVNSLTKIDASTSTSTSTAQPGVNVTSVEINKDTVKTNYVVGQDLDLTVVVNYYCNITT